VCSSDLGMRVGADASRTRWELPRNNQDSRPGHH
jgi:hypothetical protein